MPLVVDFLSTIVSKILSGEDIAYFQNLLRRVPVPDNVVEYAVELVNISRSGVLVEGKTRFVPGTRVTVHFEGSFRPAQIKGRVVRCQVSSISGGMLRYHSGIQFEHRLEQSPNEQGAGAPAAAAEAPPPPPAAPARVLVNRW